jgi:hypothetical protein
LTRAVAYGAESESSAPSRALLGSPRSRRCKLGEADSAAVAPLPAGYDVLFSHVRENPDGSVDVFYDQLTCGANRLYIDKLTDPAPTP